MKRHDITAGVSKGYAFLSVVTDGVKDAPWILGFPVDQIQEVINALITIRNEQDGRPS